MNTLTVQEPSFLQRAKKVNIPVEPKNDQPSFLSRAKKVNSPTEKKEESLKQPEKESSLLEKVGRGAGQFALGAAKFLTWPLDVLKLAMQGEGLSDIDEIETAFKKEGKPFDRKKYIEDVVGLSESVPTQQYLEDVFKEKTGVDLAPQGKGEKILRGSGEIFTAGIGSLAKQPVKEIVKRGASALAGAGSSEALKAIGVNETAADLIGHAIGGAGRGSIKESTKTTEGKALSDIAKKHELREFQGLYHETPKNKLTVSAQSQAKAVKELGESSEKAIEKIVRNQIPIKNLRNQGVDLKQVYTTAYDNAHRTAQNLSYSNVNVDTKNVTDFIKKKINDIKNSAPSLSSTDNKVIKELVRHYKGLTNTSRTPSGKVLRSSKKVTPEQALVQYKKFNEELDGIYRKAEFTGSEKAIKNMYGELKEEFIKSIDKADNLLGSELKYANEIYRETSKLNSVEKILEKSFKQGYDAKKLATTLGGRKNREFLERDLGKKAVKDLIDIAHYGKKAEEKIFKNLRNPQTMSQYLTELTPVKLAVLTVKRGLDIPAHGALAGIEIGRHAINRIQGNLFLSPKTRKSYIDFLKKSADPQSPLFQKASRKLTEAIVEEFGSEENLIEQSK